MIAKHVAMKSVKKSDFAELVSYMTDEQEKNERVGFVSVTNCQSDRPDAAVLEVINTQGKNTRAESDKTFHLMVSFPPGEQPDDVILKAIEAQLCEGLGYGEHQRVSVVHHDTDNLHIHIAVNKIHPTRYTIHDPYYGHKVIGQLCEKLEQKYGLTQVNHKARNTASENQAADMEHHAGIESLLSWVKRECLDQMQSANSWAGLHQVLQENGLALRERGNGLVIADQDGLMVKASSVSREFSKSKLEDKFGQFVPTADQSVNADQTAKNKYEARPVCSHIDTTLLFAQYRAEQKNKIVNRAKEWKLARDNKNRLIEEAKRSNNLKRASIKLIAKSREEKKLLYSIASKGRHTAIEHINVQYRREKEKIFEKHQAQQWIDWLRSKAIEGDKEALAALRAREAAQGLKGDTIGAGDGQRLKSGIKADQDSVTKKGTIIYRVGTSAIRDDGDKLKVSREATKEGLEAALRMAMERYGNRITVNGTDDFREKIVRAAVTAKLQITFADAALERRRQSLLSSESNHDSTNHQGRGTGSGVNVVGSTAIATSPTGQGINNGINRFGFSAKPNIGRVGSQPPPESRNGLRNLSNLDVVCITSGSEMLLPGNVSNRLEQQGTQPDNTLRRPISDARLDASAIAAADQYIEEREQKRIKIVDISKYRRYNETDIGNATFSGIRRIEGQSLVLLKRGEEIVVMPINEATVRQMKRLSIGDPVTIAENGSIKTTKGRRR
ncbi:MAG: conjugal transfer protein TraI [Methylovulum sp.]|nr:MAG: conjugal transfer protein TraI [Methylovulum sp.]